MIGSVRTPRLAGRCRSGTVHISASKPPGGATRRHGNADLGVIPVGAGTARRRRANDCSHGAGPSHAQICVRVRAKEKSALRRAAVPAPTGELQRSAFQAVPAIHRGGRRGPVGPRCRSETGAPSAPRFIAVGSTCFRGPVGPRCRPEVRSKRSPRFIAVGGTRFRGPAGRGADRRSAFPVPAIHRGWEYAGPCRCREVGVPSGPRASSGTRCGPVSRSEVAFQAFPAIHRGWEYAFSRPVGPRCRSETGVPSVPRDSSRLGVRFSRPCGPRFSKRRPWLGVRVFAALRGADRRSAFQAFPAIHRGWEYAFSRPCGPRCRPEVGVPSGPRDSSRLGVRVFAALSGRGADRRSAFQAVQARDSSRSGVRVFAALSGRDAGRRPALQAVPAIHRGREYAFSRPCRAAMPVGDRRSKRSPRFFAVGGTRFRGPVGPRCRSETGAPSRPRDSSRSAVFPVR